MVKQNIKTSTKIESILVRIGSNFFSIHTNNEALTTYLLSEFNVCPVANKQASEIRIFPDAILAHLPHFKRLRIERENYFAFIICALIEVYLINSNYIFLHGCSFIKDNKAYVCIGKSGTGKTTIISQIEKKQRLSNDIAIIECVKGKYFVHHSPFDYVYVGKQTFSRFPLEAVFSLSQGKENKFYPLSTAQKLISLTTNNPFFMNLFTIPDNTRKEKKIKKTYAFFLKMMENSKIIGLIFKKDISFLSSI